MSLPMVLSMLVNSLYNIVDSFFVAQISEASMTALSLVYPIQNLVNALAIGFGVGLNAAISFYLGSERLDRASAAAGPWVGPQRGPRGGPDRLDHRPAPLLP